MIKEVALLFANGHCCQPSPSTGAGKGSVAPLALHRVNPSLKTPVSVLQHSPASCITPQGRKAPVRSLSILPSLLPSHGSCAFLRMRLLPASPPCQRHTGSNIQPLSKQGCEWAAAPLPALPLGLPMCSALGQGKIWVWGSRPHPKEVRMAHCPSTSPIPAGLWLPVDVAALGWYRMRKHINSSCLEK